MLSVQQIAETFINDFSVLLETFMGNGSVKEFGDFTKQVHDLSHRVGSRLLGWACKEVDIQIKEADWRKKKWKVIRQDERVLLTTLGEVKLARTYYLNKKTNERAYLADEVLGLEKHARIDTSLKERLVESAAERSYAKAACGETMALVSRQTVMNAIRDVGTVRVPLREATRKRVKRLYVEADEDHLSSQEGRYLESRLVYVHEGKQRTGKRVSLVSPHYISGGNHNADEIWTEVLDYLDMTYDLEHVDRIFLAGDGASWIRSGLNYLPRSRFVLDTFHRNKYLKTLCAWKHPMNPELLSCIHAGDLKTFCVMAGEHISKEVDPRRKAAMVDSFRYLKRNWDGIEIYSREPGVHGCSAEGHVSHVLSARMSSRPMAWSKMGAEQMAALRCYINNHGDVGDAMKRVRTEQRHTTAAMRRRIAARITVGIQIQHNVAVIEIGKRTQLFGILKAIRNGSGPLTR